MAAVWGICGDLLENSTVGTLMAGAWPVKPRCSASDCSCSICTISHSVYRVNVHYKLCKDFKRIYIECFGIQEIYVTVSKQYIWISGKQLPNNHVHELAKKKCYYQENLCCAQHPSCLTHITTPKWISSSIRMAVKKHKTQHCTDTTPKQSWIYLHARYVIAKGLYDRTHMTSNLEREPILKEDTKAKGHHLLHLWKCVLLVMVAFERRHQSQSAAGQLKTCLASHP